MADPAPTPKAGGNVLTRKIGPLPTWAWAGIGVAGFLVWRQRKAAAAASAASTTSTATPTPASTGAVSAPSGYGYQGPGVGSGGSGPIPTGATATTSAAYAPPTNESSFEGGYVPNAVIGGGNVSNSIISDAQGNQYEYLSNPSQLAAFAQSGQSIYAQPAPGIFVPVSASAPPGNTPLFAQIPAGAGSTQ